MSKKLPLPFSEPYLRARLGDWSGFEQTGDGKNGYTKEQLAAALKEINAGRATDTDIYIGEPLTEEEPEWLRLYGEQIEKKKKEGWDEDDN